MKEKIEILKFLPKTGEDISFCPGQWRRERASYPCLAVRQEGGGMSARPSLLSVTVRSSHSRGEKSDSGAPGNIHPLPCFQMSGYNWTWPQIPSLTAMKYQRHGYVDVRPFQLGKIMEFCKDFSFSPHPVCQGRECAGGGGWRDMLKATDKYGVIWRRNERSSLIIRTRPSITYGKNL